MRLETVPIVVGALVALIGAGFILDAWIPDHRWKFRERRRRLRVERHHAGEALVGLGVVALGAALIGRDVWNYGTVAAVAGTVSLASGAWLNRHYLRELLTFRGPARRGEKRATPRTGASPSAPFAPYTARADMPPVRRMTARPLERELPIDTPGLADVAQAKRRDEPPGPEDTPPKRMRIR